MSHPVLDSSAPDAEDLVVEFESAALALAEFRDPGGEREHRAHDAARDRYDAARAALISRIAK